MNVDIIKHDTNSTCEYILPQKNYKKCFMYQEVVSRMIPVQSF